jgi:hypothetical protein
LRNDIQGNRVAIHVQIVGQQINRGRRVLTGGHGFGYSRWTIVDRGHTYVDGCRVHCSGYIFSGVNKATIRKYWTGDVSRAAEIYSLSFAGAL